MPEAERLMETVPAIACHRRFYEKGVFRDTLFT
jgi:hypothetical protein